jgi:hypothetical protein
MGPLEGTREGVPARSTYWSSFASLPIDRDQPLVLSHGIGSLVWDLSGKECVDATASLWVCTRRSRSARARRSGKVHRCSVCRLLHSRGPCDSCGPYLSAGRSGPGVVESRTCLRAVWPRGSVLVNYMLCRCRRDGPGMIAGMRRRSRQHDLVPRHRTIAGRLRYQPGGVRKPHPMRPGTHIIRF